MDVESMSHGGTGFPALARRIARNPDYESFIFRKFDRLGARNLLHLEAKLGYLEYQLDKADEAALANADPENLRSVRTWEDFEEKATRGAQPERMRMDISDKVQETLKEYREPAIFPLTRHMFGSKDVSQRC
jgi:hypothetical protein